MSTPRPTVLIFTYSEHGQANVNLATAYELAFSGVNVCIASFAPLKIRVTRLQELVARHALRANGRSTGSISFRECGGTSWREAVIRCGVKDAIFSHPHGVRGALQSYTRFEIAMFPWSREEHLASIESCREIIADIKPDVVAVDILFNIAQDACKLSDQKFVIVMPTSIKEYAMINQPYLAAFWKYPVLGSGFPFPLKWWQIPFNIYLCIRLAMHVKNSSRISEIQVLRSSLGFKFPFGDTEYQRYHGVKYICAALTEIDFPFSVVPQEIVLCGPIIMPSDPVQESEPALAKWLDNGPTVMINLGSHVISDEKGAKEMASALRILLDHHNRKGTSRMQVLWKVMTKGDIQAMIEEIIGKEINEGRVKTVSWMEAEPVSVLQHPNVICTVHHGGANSFHEGIWSGVPHIVLPVWYDTYDYANRVEFLDIGVFGNKTCAPSVQAREFSDALVRVTGDSEEATRLRKSAKHLKDVCRAKESGREHASMMILKEAGIKM